MQEIEDLIDGQPHSSSAVQEMGALWECKAEPLVNCRTELLQRYYGDSDCDVRLTNKELPNQEFFGGSRGDIIISERMKNWLEVHAGEWLSFHKVHLELRRDA